MSAITPGSDARARRRSFFGAALTLVLLAVSILAAIGTLRARRKLTRQEPRPASSRAHADSSRTRPGMPCEAEGIQLQDVTLPAGITYRWPPQRRPLRSLETFGAGCAFMDFNQDGFQDILLVARPHPILYQNLGNGRFKDVTSAIGLDTLQGYWTGCAVGDYDGDGFPDLLLTGYHCLALMRNLHGARFVDVTQKSGLNRTNRGHWGSSAGFMDLDGSGRLDLVILNYVIFNEHEKQYCELAPGIMSGCPPDDYRPEFAELWRNRGNGRFQDITDQSGLVDTHGKSLVVAFADVDGDGRTDFFIGNDGTPADFMHNLGGLRFRNEGAMRGLAYGPSGESLAAMGADWADYNGDGRLDLVVTSFSDDSYALFRGSPHGLFLPAAGETGLSGPTYKPLGFGAKWIDLDNDGWPDIVFTNGHVYDAADRVDPASPFHQPIMIFHNHAGRRFKDLVPEMGGDVATPILGRGLATGDFDNDGRMDFLAVDFDGRPHLYHNISTTGAHWITLDLRGTPPNSFAYGARVSTSAAGRVFISEVSPASSYLSSSDPRVHFGLGGATRLENVAIRWSDGRVDRLPSVPADHIYTVREGKGIAGEAPRRFPPPD